MTLDESTDAGRLAARLASATGPTKILMQGPRSSGRTARLAATAAALLAHGYDEVPLRGPRGERPYAAVEPLRDDLAARAERRTPGQGVRVAQDLATTSDDGAYVQGPLLVARWAGWIMKLGWEAPGPVVWLLDDWDQVDTPSRGLVNVLLGWDALPLAVAMVREGDATPPPPAPSPAPRGPGRIQWRLAEVLKRLDLTPMDLERAAIRCGVNIGKNTVYRLLRGDGPLRLDRSSLAAILAALRSLGHAVDVGDLLSYEEP